MGSHIEAAEKPPIQNFANGVRQFIENLTIQTSPMGSYIKAVEKSRQYKISPMGSYIEEKVANTKYRQWGPILKLLKKLPIQNIANGVLLKLLKKFNTKYRQWGPILKLLEKVANTKYRQWGPILKLLKKSPKKINVRDVKINIQAERKSYGSIHRKL
ncbi:hypothetical protein AVEN_97446-1 [Araneus ventricosus]|uniref:Uncharacterized protein n=1 Tax=Araneus ventricosus TaxID=182803 RepID=A0A4Y2DT75_ARAVE|nr:hypothetical protein AVEN_97446-1 [Araneus ventricosus]